MAGYHGITGWSGGGRRPLTYNLMPGQMRNTRVNIFQTNYAMPMATCYYADPCNCGCNDSGMPKWLQWTMLGGMGAQLLGGIFSGIFGGSEGAGGASKKDIDAERDLAQIQTSFKKAGYTISKYSDGTCEARDKNGKLVASAKTPMLLKAELDKLQSGNIDDNSNEPTKAQIDAGKLFGVTYKDGNWYWNNQKQDSYEAAMKNAKEAIISTAINPKVSNNASPTATLPNLFDQTGMNGLTTEQAVIDKFNSLTGADAVKIQDIGNDSITITNLHDPTQKDKNGSCTITSQMLKDLKPGQSKELSVKYAGQKVYAENLDGYLRIKVGSQTYIVGKADNKYTGYQFENGNVDGYNAKNPELSGG